MRDWGKESDRLREVKIGLKSNLCLALTTSFNGDENEMTRLRSVFGDDFSIRKTWFEGMGWFERGIGWWRWVGEDEDEGWVGGGRGQGMGQWSGLHATTGPCVEGWFWASPARIGLNKDGDLTGEDVLRFFKWSVLLFGCVFLGGTILLVLGCNETDVI